MAELKAIKGGRPPVVFTPEQVIELKALASVLTKGQVADYFGITEKTLREAEKRQPEVADAYRQGRVNQVEAMASNLVKLALAGNVVANIFYLKTQAGWSETQTELREIPPMVVTLNTDTTNAPDV